MIKSVFLKALTHGSAAAACKATDTVKICDENGVVVDTPPRSSVWQAQTPQIFETEIYRASSYLALSDKITVTDDCSLVEHAGFKVQMVDCGKENIKITEPIDLYFASAILKKRRNEDKK
jgi:2-C-methyl-D-erythritol 4-phosphate cytidylyltransferase